MANVDVYRITDTLDDSTLSVLVTRLEARGQHPKFLSMMKEYLDAMPIDAAASVLDLGCGTGVVARAIARRSGFSGQVTGLDLSSHLVHAATRFAAAEGVDKRVTFQAGDSHSLKLDANQFGAVVAHTLISHVEDPLSVLKEMVRVLKPGGKVGIFDGDYASLTFSADDPVQSAISDEKIISAIVTQPRIMRHMPQLMHEAGLRLITAFPNVVAEIGRADFWVPGIQSFVKLLPKSGAMTQSDAIQWADAMLRRSDQGTFFGACNFYSYVATKD